MAEWIKKQILTALRVPPEPHPPQGSPESIRIFRAGRNYWRWRIVMWALAHAGAVAGLVTAFVTTSVFIAKLPPWVRLTWTTLEGLAAALLVASLPVTFLQQKLNYELRWYILTDRSLRVRSGIWSIQELTTTFANIQEVRVTSGPLQKLLGLADVEVHSAGGGVSEHGGSSHVARFEGVDNANEIRDVVAERLRRYRDSGLGDASLTPHRPADTNVPAATDAGLPAAHAMLAEARALRASLTETSC